jgi:7,8-dihydropterin-6-yl-methyl-4-(beta-D-ribofuranosyl)aminobenzene 5'-phosphate synthase
MKRLVGLIGVGIMLVVSTISAGEPAQKGSASPETVVSVTIIYDNSQVDERLKTDWGFACLVKIDGQKLLFDAGRKSGLYQKNMEILKIDPKEIPTLFISHEHGDHTAGIPWITETNPGNKWK